MFVIVWKTVVGGSSSSTLMVVFVGQCCEGSNNDL